MLPWTIILHRNQNNEACPAPFLALAVPFYFMLSGWGRKQKGTDVMKTEERKVFIINCMYFAILLAAAFAILKYGLPMVTPFVTAFVIAYLLKGPICFLSGRLHLAKAWCNIQACLSSSVILHCLLSLFTSFRWHKYMHYLSTLHYKVL